MHHRLAKIQPKFRELLDKRYERLVVHAIYATDEFKIIQAGQMRRECAAECKWPGDPHATADPPRGRTLRSADQADQGGFSGAIAPQNSEVVARRELEADAR